MSAAARPWSLYAAANLASVPLGVGTIVLAHVVFDMVFVAAIVRTRLSYFDLRIGEAARFSTRDRCPRSRE